MKGFFRHPWRVAVPAVVFVISASVGASPRARSLDGNQQREIARCIDRASGGRQWLNSTLHALRLQEGGWIGAEVSNSDGSMDLGPMQVNSWWVPRIAAIMGRPKEEVHRWLRDDACFNIDAARWIFLSALRDAGDFWRAVGIYHSPTKWRQLHYARSVASIMAGLRRRAPVER